MKSEKKKNKNQLPIWSTQENLEKPSLRPDFLEGNNRDLYFSIPNDLNNLSIKRRYTQPRKNTPLYPLEKKISNS